ncbi:MAG: J domain-containing protein [Deltaproteobacteria bacterium]|nr:J domain-containing protein [Deltaproteobacteria bacterium]
MPSNPFEIFGLTPSIVEELSERELFEVLKGLYRNLQKAFHPDTARRRGRSDREGGRDRAVELNLAFEALNLDKNRPSFRRHRRSYLQDRHPAHLQKKATELSESLNRQAAREERLAEGYLSFLLAGAGGAQDAGTAWTVALPWARNVLLGLQDVAIKNNIRHASWLLGSNYKNIEIDSEGGMRVRAVGRRHFSEARGTVLLGCVPKDAVNITPLLERCPPSRIFKCPALTEFDPDALPQVSVLNLVSQANFKKHLLSSLCPALMESAYLFSVDRREFNASGLIRLEGVIIKMEALAPAMAGEGAVGGSGAA